jgi:hypothetical protein
MEGPTGRISRGGLRRGASPLGGPVSSINDAAVDTTVGSTILDAGSSSAGQHLHLIGAHHGVERRVRWTLA